MGVDACDEHREAIGVDRGTACQPGVAHHLREHRLTDLPERDVAGGDIAEPHERHAEHVSRPRIQRSQEIRVDQRAHQAVGRALGDAESPGDLGQGHALAGAIRDEIEDRERARHAADAIAP